MDRAPLYEGSNTNDMSEHNMSKDELIQEDLLKLPTFNLGALFMPAIWGPAHGQWITILFYPIWIFADTCLVNAVVHGGLALALGIIVLVGTAALTFFYARTAGHKAYLRVAEKTTLEEYLKKERIWAVASALIALAFLAFATWYNLAIVLPAGAV